MPRLDIEHTSLDSAPPFEALSYCWGSPGQPYKAPIGVEVGRGGSKEPPFVPLTASLAELLAYLPRHCTYSFRKTSYVWIDQICINQGEDAAKERSGQIGLMKEIYRNATRVLIWLGPGPDPATAASIADALKGDRMLAILVEWILKSPRTSDNVTATDYVWNNPWFSRTWVVQESGLAKQRQPLVGLHPVRWSYIKGMTVVRSGGLEAFSDGPSCLVLHLAAVTMWERFEKVSSNCDMFRCFLFCSLLARYGQSFEAGDPNDRVLAYMSLWQPKSFDLLSMVHENHFQVFVRLATSLLQDTRRLDVFWYYSAG